MLTFRTAQETRTRFYRNIILAPQVPADVYGILADPANYGIGVADELKIVEKPIANSLVHQYDCSVYLCGSPIVAKDNIVLKAE